MLPRKPLLYQWTGVYSFVSSFSFKEFIGKSYCGYRRKYSGINCPHIQSKPCQHATYADMPLYYVNMQDNHFNHFNVTEQNMNAYSLMMK